MSVIDTLIFDRTQADVNRVKELKSKILLSGLSSLTEAEKSEYLGGMKGAYNYTDMNRVGSAMTYIADRMNQISQELTAYREEKGIAYDPIFDMPYGHDTIEVAGKADWAMGDVPTQAQATAYITDLAKLRGQLPLPADTPAVPTTLNNLTYTTANNIERILYLIDQSLTSIADERYARIDGAVAATVYCGLEYAG